MTRRSRTAAATERCCAQRRRLTSAQLRRFGAITALICLIVSGGSSVAEAQRATSVTAGTTPVTLTAVATVAQGATGSADTLAATLTSSPDGASGTQTPVAGETIAFRAQQGDGSWTDLGSVSTDANGVAQLPFSIAAGTTTYEANFDGDATYAAGESGPVTVSGVQATTAMALQGPATDADASTIKLSGSWTYNDSRVAAGGVPQSTVHIYLRWSGSSTWTPYTTLTTTTDGQFAWTSNPQWSVYFEAVGAEGPGAASASATLFVRQVPGSTVYTRPAASPRPKALPGQARAVGSGANPVVSTLSNAVWASMVGVSWHRGCPLSRSAMRLISINYYGFDGYRHRGQLIVASRGVRDFVGAFTALFAARIPLSGMFLVDRFGYSSVTGGANDYASMQHDNTSAYNCRWVDGNPGHLSPHAFGLAVDINPFENPYKSRLGWTPNSWWAVHKVKPYTWRSYGDQVVAIMRAHGFNWTYGMSDSQHFDAVRGLS